MTTKMPPIFIIFIDTFSPSKGDNAVPKTNSWKIPEWNEKQQTNKN